MKFLSKVAEILAKGLQLIGLFQPVIQQVNDKAGVITQTVSQDLSEILAATLDSEKIGLALDLKGADKLKALIPLVGDIVLRSAALANHKISNPDLFNQGIGKLSDGAADIVNSLDPNGVQATSKAS